MENSISNGLSAMFVDKNSNTSSGGYSGIYFRKYGICHTDIISGKIVCCFEKILERKPQNIRNECSLTIADFGSADSGTITEVMNKLIDLAEQRYGETAEVTIIFEDQPLNDFNAMFKIINGIDDFKQKLKISDHVSVLVSGTTMYKKCLISNSVDLAICSIAIHWLSKKTCNIKNGMDINEATDVERRTLRHQAAEDWATFLVNRGKELKKGGYLIVSCIDDGVNTEVKSVHEGRRTYSAVLKILLERDVITEDEFIQITPPEYHRNEMELRQPFDKKDHRISGVGLELISLTYHDCVYVKGLEKLEKKDVDQVKEYAAAVVDTTKPWLYNSIFGGLSVDRTPEQRCLIADEYFNVLYEYVLSMPYHPDCGIRFAEIVIQKSL